MIRLKGLGPPRTLQAHMHWPFFFPGSPSMYSGLFLHSPDAAHACVVVWCASAAVSQGATPSRRTLFTQRTDVPNPCGCLYHQASFPGDCFQSDLNGPNRGPVARGCG
jgi:hypothetical protein